MSCPGNKIPGNSRSLGYGYFCPRNQDLYNCECFPQIVIDNQTIPLSLPGQPTISNELFVSFSGSDGKAIDMIDYLPVDWSEPQSDGPYIYVIPAGMLSIRGIGIPKSVISISISPENPVEFLMGINCEIAIDNGIVQEITCSPLANEVKFSVTKLNPTTLVVRNS